MSLGDSVYHVKGSLYMDPTGVSASSVYGTLIGYTEAGYTVRPNVQTVADQYAEYANKKINVRDISDSPEVAMVFKTYNASVAQMMFGNRQGTTGTDAVVTVDFPGTVKGGSSLPTHRYLFVPEDTTMPHAFVIHRGQAVIPVDSGIQMMLAERCMYPVVIYCTPATFSTTSSSAQNYSEIRISRLDKLSIDTTGA